MALRTPSKPEDDQSYRPPDWNPQTPSAEELERIPTASQEGIDHLRGQHTGSQGTPVYKPDGTQGVYDAAGNGDSSAKSAGAPKKLSGEDIKSKENSSSDGQTEYGASESAALGLKKDDEGGFYSGEERASISDRLRGKITKKRSAAASILGVVTVTGVLGLGVLQGPIYSTMLSNLLQKNFFKSEQTYVKRISGSLRYHKTGDPGSTRVGRLGQYVFDGTIKDLEKQGVTIDRNRSSGAPRRISIESSKNDLTKGMPEDKAKSTIARTLGVDKDKIITTRTDFSNSFKFSVNVEDYDPARIRDLDSRLVTTLNRAPIIAAMQKRVMNKFTNSNRSIFNWYENKRAVKTDGTQADRNARERARERQEQNRNRVQQRIDTARASVKDKANGTAGRLVLTAVGGVEVVCVTKALSEVIPTFNQNVRLLAAVDAGGVIAAGSQSQSFTNLDIEEMGGERESHIDEKGDDLTAGKAMSATLGDAEPKGPDIDARQRAAFTGESSWEEINKLVSQVPFVDQVCSTPGQIVAGSIGLLTLALGPGGWVATAGKAVAGSAAGVVAMNIAASAIEPDKDIVQKTLQGASGGNWVAYGARELSNMTAISEGGTVLSDGESKAVDDAIIAEGRKEFSEKSFASRLFDATDHRSLTASLVRKTPHIKNPEAVTASIVSKVNPIKNVATLSDSFTAQVGAQTAPESTYDWGFNRVGISNSILENENFADYQENAEKANKAVVENPGLIERAKKCHGVSFDEAQRAWAPEKDVDIYGKDYLESDCDSKDDTWRRVQLWIHDDSMFLNAACDKGLDEACQSAGHSNKSTSSSNTSTSTGEGAASIVQVLENEYKKNGDKPLEVCGQNCGPEVKKYTGGPQGPEAPWCAWFVSWVYREAGYEFKGPPAGADGNIPAVVNLVSWFKTHGVHFTKDSSEYKPQPGDVVMYGGSVHTGIVYKVDGDTIETIEGNTSSDNNFEANGGTVGKKKFNYKTYSSRSLEFGRLKGL